VREVGVPGGAEADRTIAAAALGSGHALVSGCLATSVEDWLEVIAWGRRSVVCATAAEHYSLITWEHQGHLGSEKYALAGIEFVDPVPWVT
jgi:hypothetical protein